jgi:hypothetical protein
VNCPRCGAAAPDDAWNCPRCRINLYWAIQHLDGLAEIREDLGLPERSPSPPFLVQAHRDAMDDRARRATPVDNKVRVAARKVMRRKTSGDGSGPSPSA